MISLGGGRQKVRFSFALPSLRDSRWYTTGCPSLHKLRAWWNWCWTRFWDVGVQGPPGPCVQAGPGILVLGEGPSPTPQSPLWAVSATS